MDKTSVVTALAEHSVKPRLRQVMVLNIGKQPASFTAPADVKMQVEYQLPTITPERATEVKSFRHDWFEHKFAEGDTTEIVAAASVNTLACSSHPKSKPVM